MFASCFNERSKSESKSGNTDSLINSNIEDVKEVETLPKYEIVDKKFNKSLKKATINVRLEDRANEIELTSLANAIKSKYPEFENYFFFLPKRHENRGRGMGNQPF